MELLSSLCLVLFPVTYKGAQRKSVFAAPPPPESRSWGPLCSYQGSFPFIKQAPPASLFQILDLSFALTLNRFLLITRSQALCFAWWSVLLVTSLSHLEFDLLIPRAAGSDNQNSENFFFLKVYRDKKLFVNPTFSNTVSFFLLKNCIYLRTEGR